MSTVKDRLAGAVPAWQADPPPEVVIRHRSGSVSARRAYPVAKNDPFVPNRPPRKAFSLIGVGSGNDVYLEPEDDVDPLSEEAKNRIKRVRNVGDGAQVLIEQAEGDLDNELRSLKAAPGALLLVTQGEEENLVDSTGADGSIFIGDGGIISATRGIVGVLNQPIVGTGSITFMPCPPASQVALAEIAWVDGMITTNNGGITIQVGCDGNGGSNSI